MKYTLCLKETWPLGFGGQQHTAGLRRKADTLACATSSLPSQNIAFQDAAGSYIFQHIFFDVIGDVPLTPRQMIALPKAFNHGNG